MNIYKLTTIVLTIVVMVLIIKLMEQPEGRSDFLNAMSAGLIELDSKEDFMQVIYDLDSLNELSDYDTLEKKMKIHPKTALPIEKGEAEIMKDDFKNWNNRRKSFKLKPFAFSFGKDRLAQMLKDIEDVNNGILKDEEDSLKIQGVRIYLVRKYKKRTRKNLNLMIVPVRGTGDDYWHATYKFKINSDTSHLYLNTSAPCPNNCDDGPEKR